ncbi:MAG: hypothetical protein JOZ18_00595 [Chloroflexi bacterium]|nr:hypothetical protein [Chloroflexota bacterium]
MAEQSPYSIPSYQAPDYKHRPLGQAIIELPLLYLKALFAPTARMFAREGELARWGLVWVQLFLLIVIPWALGFVRGLNHASVVRASTNSQALYNLLVAFTLGTSLVSIVAQTFLVPIFFFLTISIQFLLAKAFHGVGHYLAQCHTTLLYQVPLAIIGAILNTVYALTNLAGRSTLSPATSFVLFLYGILLNIVAIKGVHHLAGSKATLVVILYYVICVLLVIAIIIAFTAFIISALRRAL